jgi:hypothetical protein
VAVSDGCRLADGMDRYHAHFRYEFDRVYKVGQWMYKEVVN